LRHFSMPIFMVFIDRLVVEIIVYSCISWFGLDEIRSKTELRLILMRYFWNPNFGNSMRTCLMILIVATISDSHIRILGTSILEFVLTFNGSLWFRVIGCK